MKSYNLDEYFGLDASHPQSYHYFMYKNLFNGIDIKDENVSDEINYFNYVEAIKEKLFSEFSDIDIAMAESLIDEHLNNLF